VGFACSAEARAIASSIASLVPEPIEKWAVCAASPISTRLPCHHCSQRIVLNEIHAELLVMSRCPCSSGANNFSRNATLSSTLAVSSPARRHVSGSVSTMNVLVDESNGYAWTWNSPPSASRMMNVNASNRRVVPSQMKRALPGSIDGWNTSSWAVRTRLLIPSAATTRSACGSPSISHLKFSRTPSSTHRSCRI
jgi:hypothetical protein